MPGVKLQVAVASRMPAMGALAVYAPADGIDSRPLPVAFIPVVAVGAVDALHSVMARVGLALEFVHRLTPDFPADSFMATTVS
jgi:hypothetical protein